MGVASDGGSLLNQLVRGIGMRRRRRNDRGPPARPPGVGWSALGELPCHYTMQRLAASPTWNTSASTDLWHIAITRHLPDLRSPQ